MQKILILGAGRSASSLISYLLKKAASSNWKVTIAEKQIESIDIATKQNEYCTLVSFDVSDDSLLTDLVSTHDIVVSMLPARFHFLVAKKCADIGRHFLTASYLTEEIKALNRDFQRHEKIALMEMGLDPGIDHMSAMRVLDRLKAKGNKLAGFETFTGGLISEESVKDNPWKNKFTSNQRNVVLAGQGTCKYIQEGRYKYIPYQKLFKRTEMIYIPGHGYFEGYANRDSLAYLDVYDLNKIGTLYRGTLRRPGYCAAWDVFVQLGATEDTYEMEGVKEMTHRQFLNSFLSYNPHDSVELKLAHYMNLAIDSEVMFKVKWLGLFEDEPIGLEHGTPAQILEHILKKKWSLDPEDKDMIVMWHKFNYLENGQPRELESSMVALGEDQVNTAMSKTVGLPLAIATELILQDQIILNGIQLPISKHIYEPVLKRLENTGITFKERLVTDVTTE
ncbi:MAG: saccharopine dehydrogenase C-terminal domain-containing protein [Bacteroidota bacterium]